MAALASGETHYTDSRGLLALREAIAADTRRRFGVSIDPGRVIVTNGTSAALVLIFSLLVDSGDEVIVGTPHYPCYPNFIRISGAVPVLVPCDPAAGYALDVDRVRAAITARTRAIVVGSPANPTGAIQTEQTLRGLAELGLPIISDEIYDGLVYDGARVTTALAVSDDAYVLDGFSKRYAMTGFRLGYTIVPEGAQRSVQILQQNLFISANSFVQHAGIAVLRDEGSTLKQSTLKEMVDAYSVRRRTLIDGLRTLGFEVPVDPMGAFYVFADARRFGSDSLALAYALLERAKVGVAPGIDFGAAGEGWLRFSYANSEAAIAEGLDRIGRVLPTIG